MNIKSRISLNIFYITAYSFLCSCGNDHLTLINHTNTLTEANEQEKQRYLEEFHPDKNLASAIHLLKTYQSDNWNIENVSQLSWHRNYLDNVEVNALMAEYFLTVDLLDSALAYSKRAESLGANNKEIYLIRSLIHSKMGDQDLAIDYINKVIMYNKNDSKMYDKKGDIYLGIGDTLSALHNYELAFRKDSTHFDLVMKLASLNSQMGQIEKAKYWIDQMKESRGNENTDIQFIRVKVLREFGSTKSADSLLSHMLYRGSKEAGIELLKVYRETKQMDSLLNTANAVFKMDSVNIDAMLAKAHVFQAKGYYSSATQYYESVLEMYPQNEEASVGLGKVNGKIAYLRKVKEKRESIPNLDFGAPRKKLTNE